MNTPIAMLKERNAQCHNLSQNILTKSTPNTSIVLIAATAICIPITITSLGLQAATRIKKINRLKRLVVILMTIINMIIRTTITTIIHTITRTFKVSSCTCWLTRWAALL